jgi:hypothetical protein
MSSVSYSLDTNSLLTAWYQTYRPVSFPSFWEKLDSLIRDGRAFISEEVKNELARKDDDVCAWVTARPGAIVELEAEQLVLARGLATDFPALAKQRLGRQIADGFVIALAQWQGLTVVTAENHRGPEKIPNICEAVDVPCLPLADLIVEEGWTF